MKSKSALINILSANNHCVLKAGIHMSVTFYDRSNAWPVSISRACNCDVVDVTSSSSILMNGRLEDDDHHRCQLVVGNLQHVANLQRFACGKWPTSLSTCRILYFTCLKLGRFDWRESSAGSPFSIAMIITYAWSIAAGLANVCRKAN